MICISFSACDHIYCICPLHKTGLNEINLSILLYQYLLFFVLKLFYRFYYAECNYDVESCNFGAFCVLDDFSQVGWKTSKLVYNLPLDYVLLAVTELGQFHGEMYAMKHTDEHKFKSILDKLKEPRWAVDHIQEGYNAQLEAGPIRAVKVLKESVLRSKVDEELLEKLLEYVKVPLTFFKKALKPREPLATLCHGDYLRNNIAFKVDVSYILILVGNFNHNSLLFHFFCIISINSGK